MRYFTAYGVGSCQQCRAPVDADVAEVYDSAGNALDWLYQRWWCRRGCIGKVWDSPAQRRP
jgi:hypothetical protein